MSPMLIVQFLVLTFIICGVLIFFLKKTLFDSTQGAVNRLNRETEDVRNKQAELNEKIKEANEELEKRKQEANDLVAKMTEDAGEKAKEEKEKLIAKARQESEEILIKAQRTKDDMRKVIEKEMEMKIADFTADILQVVLSEKSTAALQESLLSDFLTELEKVNTSVVTQEVDSAEMITASKLSDQMKKKIQELISKKLGRNVEVKTSEDPKIVGGAILKLGSLALDGSLSNLVRETGTVLKEKIEKS